MHLRPPAIDPGVTSFLWGLFFCLLTWVGGRWALGFNGAISFIVGIVVALGTFLYVRIYGEDEPSRPA